MSLDKWIEVLYYADFVCLGIALVCHLIVLAYDWFTERP